MSRLLVSAALLATAASCGGAADYGPPIKAPLKLAGGKEIAVNDLKRGQEQYTLLCQPCHGEKGDGRGPAGIGLRPPPRDFTNPVFKFGGVEAGSLPPDEELHRIVKHGLNGTAMLAWDIPDPVLVDILHYIKTFSPVWTEDEPAKPIEITKDTWEGKTAEAVAKGAKLYHGLAKCNKCHPSYLTPQEMFEAEKETTGSGVGSFRENLFDPDAKFAEAFKNKLLPPDFLRHPVKSGDTPPDLFRTIGSGIGGTAMPMWKDALPGGDEDLWALAHYVRSLVEKRGTPEAAEIRKRLLATPKWAPPAEGAAPEGAAPEGGTPPSTPPK